MADRSLRDRLSLPCPRRRDEEHTQLSLVDASGDTGGLMGLADREAVLHRLGAAICILDGL